MEWIQEDRKIARKIDALLKDIERNGHEGLGKPEPLRHDLAGYWSRRITVKDRLIYSIDDKMKPPRFAQMRCISLGDNPQA